MPCSDSSSSMVFCLDQKERFVSFRYAKITCGSEIDGATGLGRYLQGRRLPEILRMSFPQIVADLGIEKEESQFILYMEWDALHSAIAEYLGFEADGIDTERCRVTSVASTQDGVEVALVILPPKELPKILPCGLSRREDTH